MTFVATAEQRAIIEGELIPQCVIACPGSGKTTTSVRRLKEIRRRLGDGRGYAALLSYTNVAVNTFRGEYQALTVEMPDLSKRVYIGTVDAFLTAHVIRAHGQREMGAAKAPFLVGGSEAFLKGFTIYDGKYSRPITDLRVRFAESGKLEYLLQAPGKTAVPVDAATAVPIVEKLGKVGAYTHQLGQYWALRTLVNTDWLLEALCRRYPHIIVDEAQDVGPLHGAVLELLAAGGATISLVGDPNQGIYEFAGADGSVLRDYGTRVGVGGLSISRNRRSVPAIVSVANRLTGASSVAVRTPGPRKSGAYYVRYQETKLDDLMTAFAGILAASQYSKEEAVVLCRGNSAVDRISGGQKSAGSGATSRFATAAVLRDRACDISEAFKATVDGFFRILDSTYDDLKRDVLAGRNNGEAKVLRRLLWDFMRSSAKGLPAANLPAKAKWHQELKLALEVLMKAVELHTSLKRSATLGHNITAKDLPDGPLWEADLIKPEFKGIRVDTVHQAKGEGIPAVLYLARTGDIKKMLEGTSSEEGRIGYVAVTRARDLLILGVPTTVDKPMLQSLETTGFLPWLGACNTVAAPV